jgi:MFS family permease
MRSHTITKPRRLPGDRPFHLLLASLAVSSCGDWLYNVALLAFVYMRTGSAGWVAATTAARVAPVVLLGPLAGVLADRFDRRRLIVASDLIRAALMLALALVAATSMTVLLAPLLAAAATAVGIVQPPCVAACTPRLVADSDLQRANALRSGIGQASIVAGPAFGAALLAISSPALVIALNAVSFVASAVAITAIGSSPAFAPAGHDEAADSGLLAELRSGVDALRGAPAAVRLVAADVLCSAVYGMLTVTLVLVGRRVGAGAGGYGLLLGGFGVGGVAGAVVAGKLDAPSRWRELLIVALGLVAVAVAGLGAVHSLAAAVAFAVIGGLGSIVGEVLSDTALARMLDDSVLARAYGFVLPACVAGIVAGSLVAGPLVAAVGVSATMALAGAFVAVVGALLLRRPLSGIGASPAVATAPAVAPAPAA